MIQDRARRLGGPGQLTELAGQRSNASSQRGPATGHGVTAQLRQPNCTPGLGPPTTTRRFGEYEPC